jgi:uncharacterized metal-binding protein
VQTARSERPILALDGCVLACARACLARVGVVATTHLVLGEFGVKKRKHVSFDPEQAEHVYAEHVLPAARALAPDSLRRVDQALCVEGSKCS